MSFRRNYFSVLFNTFCEKGRSCNVGEESIRLHSHLFARRTLLRRSQILLSQIALATLPDAGNNQSEPAWLQSMDRKSARAVSCLGHTLIVVFLCLLVHHRVSLFSNVSQIDMHIAIECMH
jgi:hypothetical protein